MNFELIIFSALLISGALTLIDILFFAPKRKKQNLQKVPYLFDNARSFFPILLLVFSVRSFAFEPFRIPSGSLKPTLLVGDLILVNKFDYGIRLPLINKKILSIADPKRGDIVVFREPPNASRYLIKRVIGVPGDHIRYENKVLTINGHEATQTFEKFAMDHDEGFAPWQVEQKQENLLGIQHDIFQIPEKISDDFDVVVPQGKYFMMGDNRDDSADSRYWGFLPDENIIGKATYIGLSVDSIKHPIRWERTAERII